MSLKAIPGRCRAWKDHVVLTDVSGFAVPEPGTWLLMFIGLAAIGGVAAKRRQSALRPQRGALALTHKAGLVANTGPAGESGALYCFCHAVCDA